MFPLLKYHKLYSRSCSKVHNVMRTTCFHYWNIINCIAALALKSIKSWGQHVSTMHWIIINCIAALALTSIKSWGQHVSTMHWSIINCIAALALTSIKSWGQHVSTMHWSIINCIAALALKSIKSCHEDNMFPLLKYKLYSRSCSQVHKVMRTTCFHYWNIINCIAALALKSITSWGQHVSTTEIS